MSDFMYSAIVTGAAGFVGVHLVRELLSRGISVTALCRESSSNIERLPQGVNVAYSLDALPKADVFYHLAWDGASGAKRGDAILQTQNAQLALHALEAAHRLGCSKFIALGTVYERFAAQISRANAFGSSDFYILSKKYAHDMTQQLAVKLGIEFVWCTTCHPIGKYIKPEQMMAYAVANLLNGVSPAFGPATALYDIVAVEDVAQGLYLAGNCSLTRREYYIGSGSPKLLSEWLEETRGLLGVNTPIGIGERPDDGLNFKREWFDIAPLSGETGYAPRVMFAEAVLNTAEGIRGI
jgi:nucleoside-diphosphate-sugar epimerase